MDNDEMLETLLERLNLLETEIKREIRKNLSRPSTPKPHTKKDNFYFDQNSNQYKGYVSTPALSADTITLLKENRKKGANGAYSSFNNCHYDGKTVTISADFETHSFELTEHQNEMINRNLDESDEPFELNRVTFFDSGAMGLIFKPSFE